MKNIQILICLLNYIIVNLKLLDSQILRAKACMILQRKKFLEDEKNIQHFLEEKMKSTKINSDKLIILALSICYDLMDDNSAKHIVSKNSNNKFIINKNEKKILELYNIENYDYSNEEYMNQTYNNFFPVFDELHKEMKKYKKKHNSQTDYKFYFVHTPLFKLFSFYVIVNTIFIFYRRISNPPEPRKERKKEDECHCKEHENKGSADKDVDKKKSKKKKKN